MAGSNGAILIGKVLASNKTLTSLNLANNGIGPRGIRAIAQCLEVNNTLTNLNLHGNRGYLPGALALAHSLSQHAHSLTYLDLSNNHLTFHGASVVKASVKLTNTHRLMASKVPPHRSSDPPHTSDSHKASDPPHTSDSHKVEGIERSNQTRNSDKTTEANPVRLGQINTQHPPQLIVDVSDNFVHEEILNSLTHGFGLFLAVVASIMLLIEGFGKSSTVSHNLSVVIYSFSLIFLYSSSLFFHAFFKLKTTKKIFQRLDHMAIYILIAGTYTPFGLILFHGATGTMMMVIVWTLGLAGVVVDLLWFRRYRTFNLILYLLQGWSILFMGSDLLEVAANTSIVCFIWIGAGGLIYTVGVVFYVVGDKIPIYHAIWHVFVVLGSFCHFVAIYIYVIPQPLPG